MRYLFDANAVIALLNDPAGGLAQRVRRNAPADFGLPAIVAHELYFGACKSHRRARNLALVDNLRFEIVAFDQDDARHAGEIRAMLGERGTPIGPYDVLIAGQARSRALVLITGNQREFQRVGGLRVENWESG